MRKFILGSSLLFLCFLAGAQNSFEALCKNYLKEFQKLGIFPTGLDYKVNFQNIKDKQSLDEQSAFFLRYENSLATIQTGNLKEEQKIRYAQLDYEIKRNQERIKLEKDWVDNGRKIPEGGLHSLPNYSEWYAYYIKHFTSVNISPEEVYEMGLSEVKKIKQEITAIQTKLGFTNEDAFYAYLKSDTFFLTDKKEILSAYSKIDKQVRSGLSSLYPSKKIPAIAVMEWPDATASTPPGMYLDKGNNSYGKDVFLFNFFGQRHNRRCMQWLYMHEAIPGHHLQSVTRNAALKNSPLQNEFFYFGNAEGWACYVEDYGKEIGMYKNEYDHLGKWEWDLVRSARLVMEVGIHYYGWSFDRAMQYWKENIKGQDGIAQREITRITNWAGQALCYKVGALSLKKIASAKMKTGMSLKEINTWFLKYSDVPLQVLLDVV